jgi:hypothetical protein
MTDKQLREAIHAIYRRRTSPDQDIEAIIALVQTYHKAELEKLVGELPRHKRIVAHKPLHFNNGFDKCLSEVTAIIRGRMV